MSACRDGEHVPVDDAAGRWCQVCGRFVDSDGNTVIPPRRRDEFEPELHPLARSMTGADLTTELARVLEDALAIEGWPITVSLWGTQVLRLSAESGDQFELSVVKKR